jgi:hypothetical protein
MKRHLNNTPESAGNGRLNWTTQSDVHFTALHNWCLVLLARRGIARVGVLQLMFHFFGSDPAKASK